MNIALKEANETEYWLELLFRSEYIEEKPYISVVEDCRELIRLLISIVKTSKELPKKTNQLSIEESSPAGNRTRI